MSEGQPNDPNVRLSKLAVAVGNNNNAVREGVDVRPRSKVDIWGTDTRYLCVTPIVGRPAIEPFRVHWGGGREYGGGFSEEAYRRAKKQQKRQERRGK